MTTNEDTASGADAALDALAAGQPEAEDFDVVGFAAYMKIDGPGIPGQATDSNHTDWIPVLSVDQSISRPLGALPKPTTR